MSRVSFLCFSVMYGVDQDILRTSFRRIKYVIDFIKTSFVPQGFPDDVGGTSRVYESYWNDDYSGDDNL